MIAQFLSIALTFKAVILFIQQLENEASTLYNQLPPSTDLLHLVSIITPYPVIADPQIIIITTSLL